MKKLSQQMGLMIGALFLASWVAIILSGYFFTYHQTYRSAGIEAFGCANITTGLIDTHTIERAINEEEGQVSALQEALNWTVDHKHIFENQYIVLSDGTIVAPDKNLEKQGFYAGDAFFVDKNAIKEMEETRMPSYSKLYEFGGMKRLTGYAPIFKNHDPNQEIIAFNAIDFNGDLVKERTWDSIKGSSFIGFVLLTTFCFIAIVIIRYKVAPLTLLTEYASKIATGDLTAKEINIKNKDEIGVLASTLNQMAGNLKKLLSQSYSNAEQVADSSQQLEKNTRLTHQAAEEIATLAAQLVEGMDNQLETVDKTDEVVHAISHRIQEMQDYTQIVIKTAHEAIEDVHFGKSAIETANEQMASLAHIVREFAYTMEGLDHRSQEIGNITEVITEIADQTNLLSLNASIEAARAGEAGAGFAVVATEIKKLAEQSAVSARKISSLILSIQKETAIAVDTMQVTTKEVGFGMEAVTQADGSFNKINTSVDQVSHQIDEISSAIRQIVIGITEVKEYMNVVTRFSERTASSSRMMYSSTEEQLAAAEEMKELVRSLSEIAEKSYGNIQKFKLA